MSRKWRYPLPLLLSLILPGCAHLAVPAPHTPIATPTLPSIEHAPAPPIQTAARPAVDLWEQLRASFVMDDCDAEPAVLAWAKRYTQNPARFEAQLQDALPRLAYVKQVAADYDVPGEFVLLPWVESQFQPVPARKNRPAGMWQIMPVTANAMGLRVNASYDERLDITASANAVMKLLKQYHDQFHDWRLATYAYNAGEFATRKFIAKHGVPAEKPAIPHWPTRNVTREHLTKLLAMACVIREPARFAVTLPTLPSEDHLVRVAIPHSMPMLQAADHAGLPVDTLKHFNAAFRNDTINPAFASYLLLPERYADQFRNSLVNQTPASIMEPTPSALASYTTASPKELPTRGKTHTVRQGDNLWRIARQYSLSVKDLQRMNQLNGAVLKPGQVLRVSRAN